MKPLKKAYMVKNMDLLVNVLCLVFLILVITEITKNIFHCVMNILLNYLKK